ncbi:MAG TPA: hypothetical protein VGG97_08910 [Bryobacteraceae bacterium]
MRTAYEEWQRAVRRHDERLRDVRRCGFSPTQICDMTQGTLLALDVAFARYKAAEAEPEGAADLLEAALRALVKPFPDGHGSIH